MPDPWTQITRADVEALAAAGVDPDLTWQAAGVMHGGVCTNRWTPAKPPGGPDPGTPAWILAAYDTQRAAIRDRSSPR
jgi:hypothetical protein